MGLFSLIGGIIGGGKQKKASKKAAQLQYDATVKGIEESARQYDTTRADFAPYQEAGRTGLERMSALLGLGGAEEQEAEISALRETPLYRALFGGGEEAILANASATGELRGGDTKHSLFRLGEDTLARLIERQLGGYGGLAGMGMGATGSVAGFGAEAVRDQNDLRGFGAAAKAGDVLTRAGINAQNWNNAGSFLDDAISSFLPGGGGGFGSFFKKLF